jgi:hypothetical protein
LTPGAALVVFRHGGGDLGVLGALPNEVFGGPALETFTVSEPPPLLVVPFPSRTTLRTTASGLSRTTPPTAGVGLGTTGPTAGSTRTTTTPTAGTTTTTGRRVHGVELLIEVDRFGGVFLGIIERVGLVAIIVGPGELVLFQRIEAAVSRRRAGRSGSAIRRASSVSVDASREPTALVQLLLSVHHSVGLGLAVAASESHLLGGSGQIVLPSVVIREAAPDVMAVLLP